MAKKEELERRLGTLKKRASELNKTIVDKDAREFLLRFASNALGDVERYLLPEAAKSKAPAGWLAIADFQLKTAAERLKRAQDVVKKYGPNVRVVGG